MTLEKEKVRTQSEKIVLRLMDEGGLENVRARTVSKEVGVSVGTIYNFYGNLDGLIEKVCSFVLNDFARVCEERIKEGSGYLAKRLSKELADEQEEARELMLRFLHLADIYVDYVEQNENRWNAMLAFNRGRVHEEPSHDYVAEQTKLFDIVGKVLNDTRLGNDEETRYHTARALWAGVHGVVLMSYLGQVSSETRDNTWRQIVLLVRYFVRGVVV